MCIICAVSNKQIYIITHTLLSQGFIFNPSAGFNRKEFEALNYSFHQSYNNNKNSMNLNKIRQILSNDRIMFTTEIISVITDRLEVGASCSTHSSPPEGVCIGAKIWVDVFLSQVDKERGKDEDEETYVPGCDQLLRDRERFSIPPFSSSIFNVVNPAVVITQLSSLLPQHNHICLHFDSAALFWLDSWCINSSSSSHLTTWVLPLTVGCQACNSAQITQQFATNEQLKVHLMFQSSEH